MRFLRGIGAVFCILSIALICLLAASVFNEELAESLKEVGDNALSAIHEFSEKAEVNVFSEVTSD
ncbi:MAG: hypothetical protein Q4G23_00540 [Clostridia bacterium]|nr:hypothetical protein [Clostridia bacterium]